MNCAPDYELTNFIGIMSIYPTTTLFYDRTQVPALNVDFNDTLTPLLYHMAREENDLGVDWNSWDYTYSLDGQGRTFVNPPENLVDSRTYLVDPDTFEIAQMTGLEYYFDYGLQMPEDYWRRDSTGNWILISQEGTRTGTETTLMPESQLIDLGSRVVDLSMVQMVATKNPDGSDFVVQLNIYDLLPNQDHACRVAGKVVDLTYDSAPLSGSAFGGVGSVTYQTRTTAKTNNDGRLTAKFVMPEGVAAGSIPITVFYYADPVVSSATSSMFSSGFVQSNQNTTIGFEAPVVRTSDITETYDEQRRVAYDPIAQSFLVEYDNTYVSAVGLYFKSKHSTLGITVELRDMVNGNPGNHVFATKKLASGSVNVSDTGTAETVFTFENVLAYKKDEWYCYVIKPEQNNTSYEIFCAEKSEIDLLTGQRIVQPHNGIMFHSPNLNSWQQLTTRDLKFNLYKSNFVDSAAIQWDEVPGILASRFITKVDEVASGDTRIKWFYSLDSGVSWVSYNPKIDVNLEAITSKLLLRADVTSLGGSYQIAGDVGIQLRIHNDEANYITTASFFPDALNLPNTIFAFADVDAASVNGSGETDITAYYSVDDGDTWTELPLKSGYTPTTTTDPYYRYEWELASPITEFDMFRGRLHFSTTNKSKTPRIANGVSFICSRE
jgi:hypothetical protein